MTKFALLLSGVAVLALAAPAFAQNNAPAMVPAPIPAPMPEPSVTPPQPEANSAVSSEAILSEPVAEKSAETVNQTTTTTTTVQDGVIPKTVTETTTEKTTVTESADQGQTPAITTETTKVKEVFPANTVKTETLVTQKAIPNTNLVNLLDFDLDKDGMLTREEIGAKLFYMFDTDGNMIIDNLELNRVGLITLIPMEKTTVKLVDKGADGKVEERVLNTEQFLSESRLIAYDQNRDGLTPLEFIGVPFNRLDANNDKAVDIDEWKDAYASYVKPKFQRQNHYN
jgi:hypothetical protein